MKHGFFPNLWPWGRQRPEDNFAARQGDRSTYGAVGDRTPFMPQDGGAGAGAIAVPIPVFDGGAGAGAISVPPPLPSLVVRLNATPKTLEAYRAFLAGLQRPRPSDKRGVADYIIVNVHIRHHAFVKRQEFEALSKARIKDPDYPITVPHDIRMKDPQLQLSMAYCNAWGNIRQEARKNMDHYVYVEHEPIHPSQLIFS